MLSDKKVVCPLNLLEKASGKKDIKAAIVNAGKPLPMLAALDAVNEKLIEPIFIGDKDKIQKYAEENHMSVVREYCGHGIGLFFHEAPQILHYGKKNEGIKLKEGMTFTIEPMINFGKRDVKLLKDNWTVVTKDHYLSEQ